MVRAGAWLRSGVLVLLALAFAAPVLLLAVASLQPPGSAPVPGALWPESPSLAAYAAAFDLVPMARGLLNSLLVLLLYVPLSVVVASLAGLGLRRLTPRGQLWALLMLVGAASIPYAAIWLPRFLLFQWLGLSGSWAPLWAPALMGGHPLLVLLCFVAARALPLSQLEAARLEGAGWLRIWWQVVVPQTRPALVATALLAAAWCWASFTDPLLYLHREQSQTAPLMLYALELLGASNWSVLMAASMLLTVPVMLVLLFAPRALNRTLGD
ncbi:MAG: hypothetical protein ABF271_08030 [Abyssibacter sp.]|uniref:hypothetical protein n=1 Tax=Abyssibacter sp. TaxID=2320200 RepID=UPI00321C0935